MSEARQRGRWQTRLFGALAGGWCAVLLASPATLALSFGELRSQSPLNAPLDITFPITLDAGETQPPPIGIAGEAVYSAQGARRPDVLDIAEVTVERSATGTLVHVRAPQRILEPYIPLIVQASVPSGVLRHRYDILFDPAPVGGQAPAARAAAVADAAADATAASTPAAGAPPPVRSLITVAPPAQRRAQTSSRTPPGNSAATAAAPAAAAAPPAASASASTASAPQAAAQPPAATPPVPGVAVAAAAGLAPAKQNAAPVADSIPGPGPSWLNLLLLVFLCVVAGYLLRNRLPLRWRSAEERRAAQYVSMADVLRDMEAAPAPPRPTHAAAHASPVHPAAPPPPKVRPDGIEVIDASGFYDDVASLLEQTLQREPRRLDLYQKLIEVYVSAGKPEQGRRIKQQLQALHGSPAGAGIDNIEWQHVLEQSEALLAQEERSDSAQAGAEGDSPSAPRWTRYYEGPGFESLQEHLVPVRAAYADFRRDATLQQAMIDLINDEVGRPTPLQPALQFSHEMGGAQIYFKREDLRLAGSEGTINLIGQMLLMRSMGKTGVVTAAASAKNASSVVIAAAALDMPTTLYLPREQMDALDAVLRQEALKHHVQFLPAEDPRDASRDALTAWLQQPERLGYVTGLRAGPDPYPTIVMDFISVVGQETVRQLLRYGKRDPTVIIGSAHGGFASVGFVKPYLEKGSVRIIMTDPPDGFVPGVATPPLPGVASHQMALREQRWLHASGRVEYLAVDPTKARQARLDCDRVEEFMPKPADAAAIGMGLEIARSLPPRDTVVILLSAFGT